MLLHSELQISSTFYKVTGHHLVLYFFFMSSTNLVVHSTLNWKVPVPKFILWRIHASFLVKSYPLFILLYFLIFNNSMYGRNPHIIYNIFMTDFRDYKVCIFINLKQLTGYFFMKTYRLNNDTEQIWHWNWLWKKTFFKRIVFWGKVFPNICFSKIVAERGRLTAF